MTRRYVILAEFPLDLAEQQTPLSSIAMERGVARFLVMNGADDKLAGTYETDAFSPFTVNAFDGAIVVDVVIPSAIRRSTLTDYT